MIIRGNSADLTRVENLELPRGPVGSIMVSGKGTSLTSCLVCDGSAVSRTTYLLLYVYLRTTFGAGDGSTTFNLPDLRGRIPIGAGVKALGASGNSTTYITGKWSSSITHAAHLHTATTWSGNSTNDVIGSHTISGTDTENLPNYLALNVIIKYTDTMPKTATGMVMNNAADKKYLRTRVGSTTGNIALYGGSFLPAGWLLCDGSAVSRTTYSSLFVIVGTLWGAGDGSTTFNLPNFNNYFLSGIVSGSYPLRNTINLGPTTKMSTSAVSLSAHSAHTHGHNQRLTNKTIYGSTNTLGSFYPDSSGIALASFGAGSDGSHAHSFSGGDTESCPANSCCEYVIAY